MVEVTGSFKVGSMQNSKIMQELVNLSLYLGQPEKEYVIMAEGNTSARIDEDTFYVKASGQTLAAIDETGFSELRFSPILEMVQKLDVSDADISQVYKTARVNPEDASRPSLETILHAIALTRCNAKFIGHTHPIAVQSLLCSKNVDEFLKGRIFTEEVTFCGIAPAVVPYGDPGLELARNFSRTLDDYLDTYGRSPRLVLLKNHGLIAIGHSSQEVKNITDMYVKVARVLLGTAAMGGPEFLSEEAVKRIDTRPDELIRMKKLGSL
jgi:rhamnose utilization protein RhaD (predicted bifunctional aldolase and dehydrogenase)